jgi:hypothetical protein
MPGQCQRRAEASAMQCSAGELRAGSRIKEKASAVPAASRWAPASGAARLGLGDGMEGMEGTGEAVKLRWWWWWWCRADELGVGCPRLQFACGVIPGRDTAERTGLGGD